MIRRMFGSSDLVSAATLEREKLDLKLVSEGAGRLIECARREVCRSTGEFIFDDGDPSLRLDVEDGLVK